MNKKAIFIHSLFRTGSTYIWNKFRENSGYHCYYEPFHQILGEISPENIERALTQNYDLVHHPHLSRCYLFEYKKLLENGHPGVPYFKKSFSFDEFCDNEVNPDLKNYIDYLIEGAGDKVPVFQFNRSALRVKWFKNNYPDSLNLYLARNPRDQWKSYVELYKRTDYIGFFLMDLLIASVNKDKGDFHLLSGKLPLLRFNETNKEENFYRVVLDSYSEEEKYLVFYYTWFKALIENVLNADSILNINLLSNEPAYKAKVSKFLNKWDINGVNFDDAKITGYSQYPLAPEIMNHIEENVRSLLISSLTEEELNGFFQNISVDDMHYFHLEKENFLQIRKERIKPSPYTPETALKKLEKIILLFADSHFKQTEEKKTMENLLKQNNTQLADTKKQVEKQNSYLAQKDQLILKKDEELQKRDLLLGEKDEQLSQKDSIINEKDQLILEKDEQLQQKDVIISEKDQLILHKDEQVRKKDQIIEKKDQVISKEDGEMARKFLLLEEKETIIAEKDRMITKGAAELQKKTFQLSEKNKQLQHKDIAIHQKNQLISKKDNQLKQLKLQVFNQKEQLSHIEYQIQKIRGSYTYRIGNIMVFPLKVGKRLVSKFSRPFGRILYYFGKYEKKINLSSHLRISFGRHRSGWGYVLLNLKKLNNPKGILFDSFIERTFCWHPDGIKPHLTPWIGVIHVPPGLPKWFHYEQANENIFQMEAWKRSLPHCKGVFTLSEYHQKYLEKKLAVPVNRLLFPTEFPKDKWTWDKFAANKEKKIVQVGWWLRKLHAIYQLPCPPQYKKIFLNVEHKSIPRLMEKEKEILVKQNTFNDSMYNTAEVIKYLPSKVYDHLLCENIIFAYLYDASANNTVIECIARNTPLLINPIEAVQEYLGQDYPLYYHSLEEAAEKAADFDLIHKTHLYLVHHPIKHKLTGKYFLKSFTNSPIYRSLKVGEKG